ncbi:Integrator complex subunit 2 [Podila humilis]|nr:Integrator complex subunit 2 [Podila humilis]
MEYQDLDLRLIQHQAKEELQLQKQSFGSSIQLSELFERGTAEDRARNPILDVQELVRDLRVLNDPESLVTALIANHPAEYYTIIESLLGPDHFGNSKSILSRLCKLTVHRAWDIRQQLLERKMFPNLAIELTIEHCHDEINFMNRILYGQPKWLTESDPVTRSSRTSILEFIFSSLNDELQSSSPNNTSIYRLLRILSGMLGLMNLSLSTEQLEILLQVLEMRPEPSTIDIKVCLILMCASQLFKYGKVRIERVLRALLKCRNSPQVLLLTIYFQTQQILLIDEFASNVLCMTIVVPREGLRPLETLFTTGFSDDELTSCALALGQSHRTGDSRQSILDLFADPAEDVTPPKVLLALYMLLNNEACNNTHHGEFPDSIFQHIQIRKILLYVQNHKGGMAFESFQPMFLKLVNAQFPELFDVTTLLMEEGATTQQILSTKNIISSGMSRSGEVGHGSTCTEDETYFKDHHLKAIIQHLDKPEAAIKAYRLFQRLPQMCRQAMSRDIIHASLPSLLDPASNSTVLEAFKNTWDQLNSVMPHQLWAMTINACRQQPSTLAVVKAGPTSNKNNDDEMTAIYSYEWLVQDPLLLFNVDLRVFRTPVVFRMFIQILGAVMVASRHYFRTMFETHQIGHQSPDYGEAQLNTAISLQDIILIQMLLEICQSRPSSACSSSTSSSAAAHMASRAGLLKQSWHWFSQGGAHDDDQVEDKTAGMDEDDMEVDRAIDDVYDETHGEVINEIRVVTFNFLHQQFIDNKILAKLIHFQGYPLDLIPIMVKGVDSIHICIEFLPELLLRPPSSSTTSVGTATITTAGPVTTTGPNIIGGNGTHSTTGNNTGGGGLGAGLSDDLELQVFALRFAAQLCERFPLPNTLQMATEVILPRLHALAVGTGFSNPAVLESATVLVKAFPTLRDAIVMILREASGAHDKVALNMTLKAIDKELEDTSVWNKSLA